MSYAIERKEGIAKLRRKKVKVNAAMLYNDYDIQYLAGYHQVRFSVVKGFIREELRKRKCQWRVEVYNGTGYVHHTSHMKFAHAMKAMKTAAKNGSGGWARLVDNNTGLIPYHAVTYRSAPQEVYIR